MLAFSNPICRPRPDTTKELITVSNSRAVESDPWWLAKPHTQLYCEATLGGVVSGV
jgi:hypothetical protein